MGRSPLLFDSPRVTTPGAVIFLANAIVVGRSHVVVAISRNAIDDVPFGAIAVVLVVVLIVGAIAVVLLVVAIVGTIAEACRDIEVVVAVSFIVVVVVDTHVVYAGGEGGVVVVQCSPP